MRKTGYQEWNKGQKRDNNWAGAANSAQSYKEEEVDVRHHRNDGNHGRGHGEGQKEERGGIRGEIEQAGRKLDEINETVEKKKKEHIELLEEIENYRKRIVSLKEDFENVQRRTDEEKKQLKQEKEKVKNHEKKEEGLQSTVDFLEQEIKEFERLISDKRATYNKANEENEKLNGEWQKAKAAFKENRQEQQKIIDDYDLKIQNRERRLNGPGPSAGTERTLMQRRFYGSVDRYVRNVSRVYT